MRPLAGHRGDADEGEMRPLLAIAALPVLVIGWQLWRDHTLEQRLNPIASGVSGRQVHVDCQSLWGSLLDAQGREGEVWFDAAGAPERKLFLTRSTCQRLRSFTASTHHAELDCLRAIDWSADDPLPFDSLCYARASTTIYALLVLAHESYHTAGVRDEAATNCFAIQGMAWVATELGAPRDEAELVARAMEALEPKQGPEYGSLECHAGGRLDLHPDTPDFPTETPLAPPLGYPSTLPA
jgi:hypothetical protein